MTTETILEALKIIIWPLVAFLSLLTVRKPLFSLFQDRALTLKAGQYEVSAGEPPPSLPAIDVNLTNSQNHSKALEEIVAKPVNLYWLAADIRFAQIGLLQDIPVQTANMLRNAINHARELGFDRHTSQAFKDLETFNELFLGRQESGMTRQWRITQYHELNRILGAFSDYMKTEVGKSSG